MKSSLELLQDAMGSIDDDLIIDAEQAHKKAPLYRKYLVAAACFVLICGAIFTGAWMMRKSSTPEKNRFINCEPGYKQPSASAGSPDGERVWAYSMQEYLSAKGKANFSKEDWLPWEQFSALGEFHRSFWWEGQPGSSQYEYEYTDPTTGKTWIYHVEFDKIPEDSGVTNIKEYYQWYYGKEIIDYPSLMNALTFTAKDFPNGDLAAIDPEDPIFANCKTKNNDFGYYVDDVLDLTYYDYCDTVANPRFVYNGWLIRISKDPKVSDKKQHAIDDTDAEILRKLMNADTYKEAIQELMNPENATYTEN